MRQQTDECPIIVVQIEKKIPFFTEIVSLQNFTEV